MDSTERLECIDQIRARTGLRYEQADELFREAGEDVVQALVLHERRRREAKQRLEARGQQAIGWVRGLVREGNTTRLVVRRHDRVLADIPVTAGIVGAVIAPELALIAGAACLFTRCQVDIDRPAAHLVDGQSESAGENEQA